MRVFVRLVIWVAFRLTFVDADYACVCTQHVASNIYRIPDERTPPLAVMYNGECRTSVTDSRYQHNGFFAVVDNREITYVPKDALVKQRSCHGQPSAENRLPTTAAPTTTTTTTTTLPTSAVPTTTTTIPSSTTFRTAPSTVPVQATPSCNKLAVFGDITLKKNVGTSWWQRCDDGITHDEGAALAVFCGAPEPQKWRKGKRAVLGCSYNNMTRYSPIGVFDEDERYSKGAGVMMTCGSHGNITVAYQECSRAISMKVITLTSIPSSFEYYIIHW